MISANSSLYSQHNFDRDSNSDNQLSISLIIAPHKSRQFGKIIVSKTRELKND
jgi:hypothetical protein